MAFETAGRSLFHCQLSDVNYFYGAMDVRPSPEHDFFPSTLEHRPLHIPEKTQLKRYFERTGADEHEGYTPSGYAISTELADLEAWIWGMRFWGRECTVRAGVAATRVLAKEWEVGLVAVGHDPIPNAAIHSLILSPLEGISSANYWANIPSEEKAIRIMALEKPLPDAWYAEPLHAELQEKPFFWGALAAWRLMRGILIKRDPAAMGLAEAACAAARARMLAGRSPEEAVADVRAKVIADLREWMGRKW
ncbi:MAG TPA: hypothetical protein VHS96_06890 [Bacteroidia bacterium]|nr:hypothetical protein [Bacteroidia bacterium]